MHLVSPLVSGITGASNGFVTLFERGTSTVATYYQDFEATRSASANRLPLDANGSIVAYVNKLVDAQVFDANGVLVREFVAGAEAPAVEVISQSFTGTDYVSGQGGTAKPTNLQVVLDAWLTSAGQPDFNVDVSGLKTSLKLAVAGLAGLFFSVKSYGAIGDGVADDGAAIQAACNAAAATLNVGGIVFFPPGSYRTTTTISVAPGVSWLGCGATASKVLVDNTSGLLTSGVNFPGTDSGSRLVQGVWFGSAASANGTPLILVGGLGAAPCVDFVNCITGGDSFTKGQHFQLGGTGQGSRVTITRCTSYQGGDANIVAQTSTGRVVIRDSDMVVTLAGNYSHSLVSLLDGASVHDCRFDALAVTSGSIGYISYAPATWDGCVFTGNRFRPNGLVTPVAFTNAALNGLDCAEYGNFFGDSTGHVTPYAGSLGFYAAASSLLQSNHGSRVGTSQVIASNNPTLTGSAEYCDSMIVSRTGAGAQTITPNAGRIGDRWKLQVVNASGGGLTITAGAGMLLDGLVTTFAVANGQSHLIEFVYGYTTGVAAAGWIQLSKGTDCG